MLNQNASHGFRRGPIEVTAIAPLDVGGGRIADHAQIGFVHQSRGLKGVTRPLTVDASLRDGAELIIHLVQQGALGTLIAG